MAMGAFPRCIVQCTGLATRPPGHLYVSPVFEFTVNARRDRSREVRHWCRRWRWHGCQCGSWRSGDGCMRWRSNGYRLRHKNIDISRRFCWCSPDWSGPRCLRVVNDSLRRRIQESVEIPPVVIPKFRKTHIRARGSAFRCRGTR